MKRYDVVIVGAGLAGLQCARLLAAQSISVLIADRKEDLARPVHTTGIFVRRTLEDFNLPQEHLGPAIRRVVLRSPAGGSQVLDSDHEEFRIGHMGALYTRLLEESEARGADFLGGMHFRGIEARAERILVTFEREGALIPVWTRYVVGADGARSKVAGALGLSVNRSFITGLEEVLRGAPSDARPALHCYLDPDHAPGYIGWMADDGFEVHLGVGGAGPAFSPSRSLEWLRRRVSTDVDLSRARVVERRGGFIPVGGVLPRNSSRRGLLIGDAAGAVSPLTAGGLDGAMRLSRYAAEVIGCAIARDDATVLELYDGRGLESRFVSRRWMRRLLAGIRSRAVVEVGCGILRVPPFDAFARHLFFGRGSFPEPDRTRLEQRAPIAPSLQI